MSNIPPILRLLRNMDQKIPRKTRAYMTKEAAYEELKLLSRQDFGFDMNAWWDWYLSHHSSELKYLPIRALWSIKVKAGLYRLSKRLRRDK